MDLSSKRRKLSNGSYEAVAPEADHQIENTSAKSKEQRRSLFVRSLPASVTTERLTEYFSQSFPLKHATVVLDPQTKISRGFGFVTFADAEDAQAAVAQFNNSVLDGRKIKVELAEARHRDADIGAKSSVNTTAVQLRAQREKNQAETQPPKLIVRNLPWSIKTAEDLSLLFRSYGKVKHAVVPKKGPKEQYGFGIVVLRGKKNAERALAGVNGKEVGGRTLAVDWAVDKKTWEELQHARPKSATPTQDKPSAVDPNEDDTKTDGAVEGDAESGNEAPDDEDLDDISELVGDSEEESLDGISAESDEEHILSETDSAASHPESRDSTGFVCFFNIDDAKSCVKNAPKHEMPSEHAKDDKRRQREGLKHSILENEAADPSGRYTLEGRVLQVSRALSREDAERRASEASEKRDARDRDRRRLYLLSEGSIPKGSRLYEQLGKAEIDIRESSSRQRQRLIKSNPNLCLSLTRLSVRNLPRGIGSKELKALAREAVVGFAKDVKAGLRQPLSKEELRRGGSEMQEAERRRKLSGKGIVKQAKVVFEDKEGSKVKEGAGRSRGYGFIEYVGHRNALAGLRWLNGHMVKSQNAGAERGKRLIVEFAIENAQVIQRRNEREQKARDNKQEKSQRSASVNKKRKRGDKNDDGSSSKTAKGPEPVEPEEKNRIAKRNRIIAKKRQARKARKG
ncbi:hypothetical protein AYL99_05990 [Fonsecaea erecta]|uniref:RRM domain-containing protein n=1 Tax=Fonsecaea erecta TaxID=1367422 RepID=A0A178ZNM9_9EURO|nr:hypothetical protein AYL99_05990 [Fonsecaea erecta]OAP60986.1 hypothetical protein AYL99_05990 [Fonsecaea erecta]